MNGTGTQLAAIHNAANDYLFLDNIDSIDYVMSLIIANRFRGCDPVWGFVIAPPSSTKTEILSALDGCHGIVFSETISEKALASGYRAKGDDKDGQPADPSLLHRWNGNTVICKEFTGTLTMRGDKRASVLSILRQAHDGRVNAAWGTGAELQWKGKFGFIAAVTPVIDRHTAVLAALGERFLYYRLPPTDGYITALYAQMNAGNKADSRKTLAAAVKSFLDGFPDVLDMSPDACGKYTNALAALSALVAILRTPVHRTRDMFTEIDSMPEPEGPGRLVIQLTTLAAGIALVRGMDMIDENEYQLLMKAATDSVPRLRTDAFMIFARTPDDTHSIADVGRRLNMPYNTVKRICGDLQAVGALREIGTGYIVSNNLSQLVKDSRYC